MKLAQYDGENNIAPRKISKKYKDIYKRNYYKVRCANSEMIDIFMYDDELTVIKTKYTINGEEGTIALIGPKRMEYDRVITLLEYIKNSIGSK